MSWNVVLSKQAKKDLKKIVSAGLQKRAKKLLDVLQHNPYEPPYEKLKGDLKGYYSRRITIQHRLVYQVLEVDRTVKVLRLWSHYE